MFVDFRDQPPPPPWDPRPRDRRPKLTAGQERVLARLIGLNLLLLLVAPIGGATLFAFVASLFR